MLKIPDDITVWMISDIHFGHRNIIKYCDRPFESIEDMNETIYNNWCDTVADDDIVFFLGDFVLGVGDKKNEHFKELYDSLPGHKRFLRGNHDEGVTSVKLIDEPYLIEYKGKTITLFHYPPKEFDTDFYIHGHIHSDVYRKCDPDRDRNIFNVNVEAINYTPINLNTILFGE